MNDFQNCLEFSSNVSFADDTNVFFSGSNIKSLHDNGNKELCNIDNWMLANKLTVNVKKTKCILFKTSNPCKFRKTSQTIELKLRNEVIEKVSLIRFLCVTIHENRTWMHHKHAVKKKMRAALGAVMRIRSFLNRKAMLTLHHSPRTLLCRQQVLWERNYSWSAKTNLQQICKNYFWTKSSFKC